MHTWKTPTPPLIHTRYGENAFFHNERSFKCACWRNSSEQESCIRVARALPIGMPLGCFLLYLVISVCVWFTRHECSTNIRHHVAKWKTPRHQMVSVVNTVFLACYVDTFFAVIHPLCFCCYTCQRRSISLGRRSPTLHALCTRGGFRPLSPAPFWAQARRR